MDATSIFSRIPTKAIEFYKCLVLTVIAILLSIILFQTPNPFTIRNIQDHNIELSHCCRRGNSLKPDFILLKQW